MRQRNQRTLAIFALAIALIATTVAYAVLQTSLNISASVTRKGGSWDIAITEIGQYGMEGYNYDQVIGSATGSEVQIGSNATASVNGTKASLKVTLNPNESAKFYVKIENRGTLDATLTGVNIGFKDGQQTISTASEGTDELWHNGKAINIDGHLTLQINKMLSYGLSGTDELVFTITYDDLGKTELTGATDDIIIDLMYRQA